VNQPLTPSQTVGPFLAIGLPWPDGPWVVRENADGAITISGRVLDGLGNPVRDALVETWQAAPDGSFAHPDDPRAPAETAPAADPARAAGLFGGRQDAGARAAAGSTAAGADARFRGFGRCATDAEGRYRVITLRPGPVPGPDGRLQAPHIDVSVFARGLLDRLVTRIYLPDEQNANAADPVLSAVPEPRRATLIADGSGREFRFDIRLQGEGEDTGRETERESGQETVFFDV
jgi:protocatechuate 3,4-dioxygenase alpha subunit